MGDFGSATYVDPATGLVTTPLSGAAVGVIQNWVSGQAPNHGFQIYNFAATDLVSFEDTEAAAVADAKLGFPAMGRHRGSPPEAMPGRHMPAAMHEMGRSLHRLADEFARTARKGDLAAAVAALQPVTANCVACHLSYRIR